MFFVIRMCTFRDHFAIERVNRFLLKSTKIRLIRRDQNVSNLHECNKEKQDRQSFCFKTSLLSEVISEETCE